jgi:HEAT repeat protein
MRDEETRYSEALALPEAPSSMPALLAALGDEGWRVRRLAAERLATLSASVAEVTPALVSVLGDRTNLGARNAAAQALSRIGPRVVPAVVKVLRHGDTDQRKFAAEILGDVGSVDAVAALRESLADSDPNVRAAGGEALGRIGGAAAIGALTSLLGADDVLLRVVGLEGLTLLRSPPALARLAPLLNEPATLPSALRLLGTVAHPAALRRIAQALREPRLRTAALEALGQQPRPVRETATALAGILHAEDDVSWVASGLSDDRAAVRRGALEVVRASREVRLTVRVARAATGGEAELGLLTLVALGPRAVQQLLESPSVLVELPADARAAVEEALVRLADASMVPALAALLRTAEPDLVELSLRGLGASRSESAVEVVAPWVTESSAGASAARALVHLSRAFPERVRQVLAPMLVRSPPPSALMVWASVDPVEAPKVLRLALKDESVSVRVAAVAASAVLGAQAEPWVTAALRDEAWEVRTAGVRVLPQLARAAAVPLIARALADAEAQVLAGACRAAAVIDSAPHRARLLALVSHPTAAVATAAVEALAWCGGLDADALQRAGAHADPDVLLEALQQAADVPAVIAVATVALTHPRWDLRAAAARVLSIAAGAEVAPALRRARSTEADEVAQTALDEALAHVMAR